MKQDKEVDEIKKVLRRIPGWFIKTEQKNSKILMTYLRLSSANTIWVHPSAMEKNYGLDKESFRRHFNNMRYFSSSIGKVFDTRADGTIELWEPVADFIIQEYKKVFD